MSTTSTRRRTAPSATIGLIVHSLVAIPYLLTGLLTSFWSAVVLWTAWTVFFAAAIRFRRRRPGFVTLVPLMAIAVWVIGVWATAM
ncbi:MAG TPA: hypothetical protein VK969_10750 [Acidimicrobiia bacterium]|nr:hypothetical protein [Acidimicrobiia bacterium]